MTGKYKYNMNKNTIETIDGQCIAYLNVVDANKIVFLLNWQNELIKDSEEENGQLKKENNDLIRLLDRIEKDYKDYYAMDIRNAEWFTAW